MDDESKKIMKKAIDIEIFGYNYYRKLKNLVNNKEGQSLLGFLANAEEEHENYLRKTCRRLDFEPEETELGDLIADVLMDEGLQKIFDGLMEKEKLETVDAIEAIELGLEVEGRSINFYKQNAKKSPEEDIAALFTELSSWEQEHFDLLKENLRMLKDEGVWYGYTPLLEG